MSISRPLGGEVEPMQEKHLECESFCRWVNGIQYTRCFSLWVKAMSLSALPARCFPFAYDAEKKAVLEQLLQGHRSTDVNLRILREYLSRGFSADIPEEAEFSELVDAEWKSVSDDFAIPLLETMIRCSPLDIDEDEDDPLAVARLFPVSDELAQDFEEIRKRLFEEFHVSSPFAFFSNLDTLDISAAYDDDVPALMGINDALIFVAWIN